MIHLSAFVDSNLALLQPTPEFFNSIGQKRTWWHDIGMSGLPPNADIGLRHLHHWSPDRAQLCGQQRATSATHL